MRRRRYGRLDLGGEIEIPRIASIRDVLVVPSPGFRASEQEWLNYPPVEAAVDLGRGVRIECVEAALAEQVMNASTPRGLNFEATRQFGQLYSFVREVPKTERESWFAWDTSQAISEAVALSRFVLDNGHSLEFAGRVIDRTDGSRQIAPLSQYDGVIAYRARKDRDWLTIEEAEELHTLLDDYRAVKNTLSDRVKWAFWYADRSCYSRYVHEAIVNVTTGLEALLNTGDDEPVAKQFKIRSQALAAELGISTSKRYWTRLYEIRSGAVHGAPVKLLIPIGSDGTQGDPPKDFAKIAKAQDVLRAAIRRAVEDDAFRAVFENDDAIRERWPLDAS